MKSSVRAIVLSIVLSLTLACAAISNPQVLLGGKATATPRAEATEAAPKVSTQRASTPEATAEGGEGAPPALSTSIAATLEAALGGTPIVPPAIGTEGTPLAPSSNAEAGISVADSLNILLGESGSAAALPSYHLEVKQLSPVMSNGKVAQSEDDISADVQGANIHYTHTTIQPGGKPVVSEAYIIGSDKFYTVKDGKVASDLGMVAVAWSTWPINVELMLGVGALKTTPAGTETVEGRTAAAFTLGGSTADDPSGALAALGLGITDVSGKLLIDKETGALLQATVDYKAQASGGDSTSKDTGAGHFELTVTQIGKVTVTDPGK